MRKQLLILSAIMISMTVFGQKDELKAADKAIDAGDYATAVTTLGKVEGMLGAADQKTKANYYYLKALALYQNGASNVDVEKVSVAFNDLINFEKESGKKKYSSEIEGYSQALLTATATQATEAYQKAAASLNEADYAEAGKKFHLVYMLSPKDTVYLDNAALIYNKAQDHETSIKLYNELLSSGYTGITTVYSAVNKANGKEQYFDSKKTMDSQVKLGIVENPKVEIKESRRNNIFKFLADNYVAMGENDKALEVIAEGRKEFPKSYELLITEANIYFKKDNKVKFKELLEEAIRVHPEDANLWYNVGVMNMDQKNVDEAIANFQKAIELNPDFSEAYQNIGTAIIDKTLPIVEEMNQNLSNFEKYDELQAQQFEIYKEALPYYEKAYELSPSSIGVVQTLLGLYENLEMTEKLQELRLVYEGLK